MRKIKYILAVLLIILLLPILFIGITNNELKGTWVGRYSVSPEMELYLPHESVMTLGHFSYSEQGPFYEPATEHEGYYFNFLNKIKSKSNFYNVTYNFNDSLQVKNDFFEASNYITFHRIDDSLKNNQNIKLAGKKFLLSNYKVQDTIHFKKDSTYTIPNFHYPYTSWQLINHNGFQILFMRDFPTLVVSGKTNDIINLIGFENSKNDYKLIEIIN